MSKAKPSTRSDFIREYIAKEYPNQSKDSASSLYGILNKAELYADQFNKPILSFQTDDFIAMFIANNWFGARGSFDSAKSKLFQYLRYQVKQLALVDEKTNRALFDLQSISLQDLDNHIDLFYYFKSESDFLSHLAHIEDERYTQAKMICILYWYGFSRQDIAAIEKADVIPDKRMVRDVVLYNNAFDYLYRLSKMDDIKYLDSCGRVRLVYYLESKYLIRKSVRSKTQAESEKAEMVSSFVISEATRDLSAAVAERPDHKKIHAASLQSNKIFCDLYDYEQKNAVDIAEFTYTTAGSLPYVPLNDESTYRCFKDRYLQWRKFFYNV